MRTAKTNLEPIEHLSAVEQKTQKTDKPDLAARAGLAKNRFFETDRWQVGRDDIKIYNVPRNTIPEPMAKAFVRSGDTSPVTDRINYNQRKFELEEMTDVEGGRVVIILRDIHTAVADVTFEKNSFVVNMFELPKSGVFACSKEELAKAIHAAKWTLEIYVMPQFESDSESSCDIEAEKL